MLKKAFLVVSGNAFGSALLLLRNLIVARLVSPHDYGIASTFAISMSIVEMLSYLGLNQLMVVDKDGDDDHFQRAMQGFQVIRGLFSSTILFLIAHPYANFLGIPEIAWAYQIIAVIPFINGLQHYDNHRMRRHLNFRPAVVTQSVAPLIAVILLWPIAMIYSDYRIMLVSLLVQSVASVSLTHIMAERPYRLAFDMALMRKATIFGWPLLLNGIMLFGVFNGERLIVGRELGMAQLAVFSMAITLTLTPTLVLAGASQSLFLPKLTAARDDARSFNWFGVAAIEGGLAIGLLLLLGTVMIGGPVVHILLGAKYEAMLPILVPMAVMQAVRVAKSGAATVALAKGRSGNSAVANFFRILSLPLSWYAVVQTGSVFTVLWIAAAAEALGFFVSLRLAAKRTELLLRPLLIPVILFTLACAAAAIDNLLQQPQTGFVANLSWSRWVVAAMIIGGLASMTALRGYLVRRFV
ncbi:MAG: oligosaccharide flippase family protein [Proteobacteria bacterium]|nr:oligosaccharide flippase family protein [Pseudomonadota bacterium]